MHRRNHRPALLFSNLLASLNAGGCFHTMREQSATVSLSAGPHERQFDAEGRQGTSTPGNGKGKQMRKLHADLSIPMVVLALGMSANVAQAAAVTANAGLDWSTFQVQVISLSGTPVLTWDGSSQTGYILAQVGSVTNDAFPSDWTTSASVNASIGSYSSSSAEDAAGLSTSITGDGGYQFAGAYRYGYFSVSGGDAVVTISVSATTGFQIDAVTANSSFLQATAGIYLNNLPTSSTLAGFESRSASDRVSVSSTPYVLNGLISSPLHASMYLGDGESGNLYAGSYVSVSQAFTPVPDPSALALLGSAVIGLFGFLRRRS